MSNFTHVFIVVILLFKIGLIIVNIVKYKTFLFPLKVLYFILIASFFTDLLTYLLSLANVETALIVNIYILLEGLLFIIYFKYLNEKWAFPWGVIIFTTTGLVEWIVITQNRFFLDIASVIESVILMMFSLRYFARMLGELKTGNLLNNPFFWINCAVLIYFSGSLFLFAFGNLIMENSIFYLWHLYNFIQFIYLLLIGIAFWKARLVQI